MVNERYISPPSHMLEKLDVGTHVTRDWGRILIISPTDVMPRPIEVRADNAFQACRPYPQYGHYIVVVYPYHPKVGKCLLHFPACESANPTEQHYHGVQP